MEKEALNRIKALVRENLQRYEMYQDLLKVGPENMKVEVDEHDKTKLNISFDAPARDIDIDIKYAFSAETMWRLRLKCIGGCRLPRGMQKES